MSKTFVTFLFADCNKSAGHISVTNYCLGVTTIINRHFFYKVMGSLHGNAIFENLVP